MPDPIYLAVTAIHATTREADEPSSVRINEAFRTVFSPDKGWTLLGGAPRITRTAHRDDRPVSDRIQRVGLLQIGAGILAAPLTMGASLGGAAATGVAEVGRQVATAFLTTTATAVVSTTDAPQAARNKIRQEFARVLGSGWGTVVVEPYSPAVNGPLADWQSGAVQRASHSTDTTAPVALITSSVDNPVGPTPANPPSALSQIVGSVSGALRAGVVQVTGAAADGLRNLGEIPTNAARSLTSTVLWVLFGVVAIGAAALAAASFWSRRSPATVAKDAFGLTPAGRAMSVTDLFRAGPPRPLRANPMAPPPPPGLVASVLAKQGMRLDLFRSTGRISAHDARALAGEIETATGLLESGQTAAAWAVVNRAGKDITSAKIG